MSVEDDSLKIHRKLKGKIEITAKAVIKNINDLSLLYTPGVAYASKEIKNNIASVYDLTMKNNTVAIVSDGTRVLGLGDIGPEASLPVLEGKALIMKQFANIDAFPIALKTKNMEKIIDTIKNIAPVFGAINLEDIETPKVFEIEKKLEEELDIPVFHDDQHGTAVVVLAALINALKITGRKISDVKIAVVGTGSAGYGITKLLNFAGAKIVAFDSSGAIGKHRNDLSHHKKEISNITNKEGYKGTLTNFRNADVIISAAMPGALPMETIRNMAKPRIVFALANPISEVSLEEAKKLEIDVFGTGRSDYPNQINNSLCFPGFLRALLDLRVKKITNEMKIAAANAIAETVEREELESKKIVPDVFNKKVVGNIVRCVKNVV